ncbi:MAG TPA: hypothetical protein ENN44_03775 [Methanoculleus sp.]|nr:hypothetical protein [Methanoculleus sp.]
MKDRSWILAFALSLIFASAMLYALHFEIFHDLHHIGVFFLHELAFLPLEVLFVTLILHRLLEYREKKNRIEKMNMVIGTFYSRVGRRLIRCFSRADPKIGTVQNGLLLSDAWTDERFGEALRDLGRYDCRVEIGSIDLEALRAFLMEQEDFLLRLLENPVLLEHEEFTGLLQATFHMTEELAHREDFGVCPPPDMSHLEGDINRVYGMLVTVWIRYMQHLKRNYPYLFSLAMRTNPFDEAAPVMVME